MRQNFEKSIAVIIANDFGDPILFEEYRKLWVKLFQGILEIKDEDLLVKQDLNEDQTYHLMEELHKKVEHLPEKNIVIYFMWLGNHVEGTY